jgi:hypothetical protein
LRWPSIIIEQAKKNNELEEAREGRGEFKFPSSHTGENVWLWLFLRDRNFLVSLGSHSGSHAGIICGKNTKKVISKKMAWIFEMV